MSTAIIGTGIGGLTTALLLTKAGKQVTMYEKQNHVGGRLTFEKHGEYRIDQGPTIVLLPDMLLSILEEGDFPIQSLDLVRCDPMYRMHFSDGITFDKYQSMDQQIEELKRVFPNEVTGFLRFIADYNEMYPEAKKAFLERSFIKKAEFFTPYHLKLLRKLKVYLNMRDLLRNYFQNEKLIDTYALQTLYIGGIPQKTSGLYSLVTYAEQAYGVWYLKGGYATLAEKLYQELKRRDVTFYFNTQVEQFIIENNQCKGIRTEEETHLFDEVVFNGESPNLERILNGESRPLFQPKPSTGCILIYLGLNREWENVPMHQFFLNASLTEHMEQLSEGILPIDPTFYVFYPSAIDKGLAPKGHSVLYFLIPVPTEEKLFNDQSIQRLKNYVFEKAETVFRGLRQAIKWQSIRTPIDAQKDGLYKGGSFGIAPVLTQSGPFRPQFKPSSVSNLYAVGASIHPGGGVPIVMQGAKLLTEYMKRG